MPLTVAQLPKGFGEQPGVQSESPAPKHLSEGRSAYADGSGQPRAGGQIPQSASQDPQGSQRAVGTRAAAMLPEEVDKARRAGWPMNARALKFLICVHLRSSSTPNSLNRSSSSFLSCPAISS